MSVSLTRHITNPARTTNYGGDGTGRDTYIYMSNGGFVPQKMATQVEEIGKFDRARSKHRFRIVCDCEATTPRPNPSHSQQTSVLY